jgi:hypothetical protein
MQMARWGASSSQDGELLPRKMESFFLARWRASSLQDGELLPLRYLYLLQDPDHAINFDDFNVFNARGSAPCTRCGCAADAGGGCGRVS